MRRRDRACLPTSGAPARARATLSIASALVAVAALSSCRTGLRPADVAATSRAVADAKKDPTLPRTYLLGSMLDDRAAFPWTGTQMALSRRGPVFHARARLVVDLVDGAGASTEFTVDTGTSMSCLSTFSSAAALALRTPGDSCSRFKDGSMACRATIPSLVGGGLRAATAPVLLVNRRHDLSDSTNLFGMTWMAGLALVHDAPGDRWRFVPGGSIPPRAGWSEVRMEAPALPVVRLAGAPGEPVYALIDTGAPTSLVEACRPRGTYRLVDTAGHDVIDVHGLETAPWRDLDPGGRHVTVWIGLTDLETRSFVMDFLTGVWSIAPAETVAPRRGPGR